jgi:hypothetical protein
MRTKDPIFEEKKLLAKEQLARYRINLDLVKKLENLIIADGGVSRFSSILVNNGFVSNSGESEFYLQSEELLKRVERG